MTIIKDLLEKGNKKTKKDSKKKAAKNIAIGAGVGTAVGLAAGILLAPKSGKETREDIAKGAKNAVDSVKETITDAKDKIAEFATGFEGSKSKDEEDQDKSEETAG